MNPKYRAQRVVSEGRWVSGIAAQYEIQPWMLHTPSSAVVRDKKSSHANPSGRQGHEIHRHWSHCHANPGGQEISQMNGAG